MTGCPICGEERSVINARGWSPIGLKTGGIKRYQPTSVKRGGVAGIMVRALADGERTANARPG